MKLDKLSEIREKNNMTYKEVADKLGISKEFYWMIENGKRTLTYDMAVKIAIAFDTEPDNIFFAK